MDNFLFTSTVMSCFILLDCQGFQLHGVLHNMQCFIFVQIALKVEKEIMSFFHFCTPNW